MAFRYTFTKGVRIAAGIYGLQMYIIKRLVDVFIIVITSSIDALMQNLQTMTMLVTLLAFATEADEAKCTQKPADAFSPLLFSFYSVNLDFHLR